MERENLKGVGEEIGVVEDGKGQGRPIGATGALPNLKTMTKKDLQAELGKSRKKVKDFEGKLAEQAAGPVPASLPPEMWAVFPQIVYDLLAVRFGAHWRLNEKEVLVYGDAVGKVADRYMGELASHHPELFALAIVAVSTAVPRVMVTIAVRKQQEPKKEPEKKDKKESDTNLH